MVLPFHEKPMVRHPAGKWVGCVKLPQPGQNPIARLGFRVFTATMVRMQDIRRYCDAIAAEFKPQRIILFGSHAYGKPTPDSDVDLLVIMPRARRQWMQTTQQIHERLSAGFPVDILVRDPVFLQERLHEGDNFLEEITTKGRVMYESRHA